MLKERRSKALRFLGLASAMFALCGAACAEAYKEIDLSNLPALESGGDTKAAQGPEAREVSVSQDPGEPFFVLCYHRFLHHADEDEDLAQAEYQMPLEEFQWQMQYLKDNGFHPISQEQLKDYWFEGKPLPLKPVLITFDDGFRTIYRDAFPVMKTMKYPSILFLYTAFVKNRELADKRREEEGSEAGKKAEKKVEALEDSDILEMQKSEMVVESHTTHHLNLGKENEKRDPEGAKKLLTDELSEPLTFIETRFKRKPQWLAYPYGVYDPAVLKAVEDAGYQLAFTVNPGPNDRTVPPLMLKRNLVLYPISHERFARIFTDKVLHLKKLTPADGALIDSPKPVISGKIEDEILPKSVKVQIGNQILKAQYNPKTHLFRHVLTTPLKRGGHIFAVQAKDKDGNTYVYNWYFRIKHTKDEKNKTGDEGGDATQN